MALRILGTLLIMSVTGYFFLKQMARLWSYMKAAQPSPDRSSNVVGRLGDLLLYGIFQKRLLNRAYGGSLHVMIFWGFCVLSLANLTLIVRGFLGPEFDWFGLLNESGKVVGDRSPPSILSMKGLGATRSVVRL